MRFRGFVMGLALLSVSAYAAPAEQADCAYAQMSEDHRLLIGAGILGLDYDLSPLSNAGGLKEAHAALDKALASCSAHHGWDATQSDLAADYSMMRMLADIHRYAMVQMGADGDVADLFFAQNKYQIMDEKAAGLSSEEWANTRLIELGFAKKGSKALNLLWVYYRDLFEIDVMRENFVAGKRPDWIK
jgi:hypothetical protein